MKVKTLCPLFALLIAEFANAAAPVEVELTTERGVQITAPHEWLQLLTTMGIGNVQIRGAKPGDVPTVTNRGSADRPRYRVVGVLTTRDQLLLPGKSFTRGDRAALKDYFAQLNADGAESLTSPRGHFGLTPKEMSAVNADLSQPIDFVTKGQSPRSVLERLQTKFHTKIEFDSKAELATRSAKPVADDLNGVAAGTGLVMLLRSYGLTIRPEKQRGRPVVLRIAPADGNSVLRNTMGRTDDLELKYWPIGWEPQQAPGRIVPKLFEPRSAVVDGFTLEQTLAEIQSRIKIPIFLDHAALAAHRIDPAKVQVRLERTLSVYKRIIDRVLAQARLHSQVRVDEAGRPFLWVTR